VIRTGALRFIDTERDDVLVFERSLPAVGATPAERVLLAFNFSGDEVSLLMPEGWASATIDSGTPLRGAKVDASTARLILSPFGALCSQSSRTEH
jgi:hypothetical protein